MSIHLVGGGPTTEHSLRVYGPFVAEAVRQARRNGRSTARVGVVQLHEDDEAYGTERYEGFAAVLQGLGYSDPVPLLLPEGERLAPERLQDLDALLVGGGLTPAYLTALAPVRDEVQALVAGGAPYLGFSAGAAIAPRRALLGGWKIDDLVVCDEDNGEELDELTVADGLSLVDFSVDVHVAQWGNLSRVVMAVARGRVERAVGVDESTALVVNDTGQYVKGAGQVWWIDPAENGVLVRTDREHGSV